MTDPAAAPGPDSARSIATVVYALQAAAVFVGLTALVGVIVNYIKRPDVAGTWLESHFRWQIRTFWFGLLWGLVGILTTAVAVGYLVLLALLVWWIYRVVKGWLYLADGKGLYGAPASEAAST